MESLFESQAPFVIKVYFDYFQITWESNLPLPEDKYSYKDVDYLEIIVGKKSDRSIVEILFRYFFYNKYAAKVEDYDELHIVLKNGKAETRYIHGQATESILEAIEIINSKLNLRENKK